MSIHQMIMSYKDFYVLDGTTYTFASKSVFGPANAVAITGNVYAGVVYGGATPLSFYWEYLSGDAATVNSLTSSTTTFTRSVFVNPTDIIDKSGTYRCRITDSVGRIIYGPVCTVETRHIDTN